MRLYVVMQIVAVYWHILNMNLTELPVHRRTHTHSLRGLTIYSILLWGGGGDSEQPTDSMVI